MIASDYIIELQKLIDTYGDLPMVSAKECRDHGASYEIYDLAKSPSFKSDFGGYDIMLDKAFSI